MTEEGVDPSELDTDLQTENTTQPHLSADMDGDGEDIEEVSWLCFKYRYLYILQLNVRSLLLKIIEVQDIARRIIVSVLCFMETLVDNIIYTIYYELQLTLHMTSDVI